MYHKNSSNQLVFSWLEIKCFSHWISLLSVIFWIQNWVLLFFFVIYYVIHIAIYCYALCSIVYNSCITCMHPVATMYDNKLQLFAVMVRSWLPCLPYLMYVFSHDNTNSVSDVITISHYVLVPFFSISWFLFSPMTP